MPWPGAAGDSFLRGVHDRLYEFAVWDAEQVAEYGQVGMLGVYARERIDFHEVGNSARIDAQIDTARVAAS